MPFLLAVTAADVAVVVAVALVAVAVAVAGLLEVGSLERQLAVAAADEVDLLELFVGEEVSGDGRQHVLGVLVVGKAERSFFQRCDASSQRSEGIFHADSLQFGSVGLRGCDRGLAGLHDLGPDWVSETG